MPVHEIVVIGGGLAGCEAAWQIAHANLNVTLYEMRPARSTPAHKTDRLAELVCSNSLKSNEPDTAPWLLKEELRRAGSLLLAIADRNAIPGGAALAVDRELFSVSVTEAIAAQPRISLCREEVHTIPQDAIVVVATGPLTSHTLAQQLARLTGASYLYFYDAISPIVDAETIDYAKVFRASRYGKGGEDYLNCPLTKTDYDCFYDALLAAEEAPRHAFEHTPYFEACLPIEELARRGRDTLRFGPMKPVGLIDPRTGRRPYAVVQLRPENLRAASYNLVGFQNHLKFAAQKRLLRMIPGLEHAEFLRYGQVHRNTYINAPALLTPMLQLRTQANVFLAGQLCGTEGYGEAIATGFIAGTYAARWARGEEIVLLPRESALGSLVHYITQSEPSNYQPANFTFDLLPALPAAEARAVPSKRARRARQCRRALAALDAWLARSRQPAEMRRTNLSQETPL